MAFGIPRIVGILALALHYTLLAGVVFIMLRHHEAQIRRFI